MASLKQMAQGNSAQVQENFPHVIGARKGFNVALNGEDGIQILSPLALYSLEYLIQPRIHSDEE